VGDEYKLVGVQEGWYEIELTDGQNGWVSKEYVDILAD
jgi:hypothetical protein